MCLCLEAGQCVQAAVLNSTCSRTREEPVNPRGGRGMDVSLHFLCTPSCPPLWGGLPCGKLGINLHYSGHSKLLKSAGKNPPLVQWWGWGCRGWWQERWGAGGTWCESLGDGKGALSPWRWKGGTECRLCPWSREQLGALDWILQEMVFWPGRVSRWMLQLRLCGRARNRLLTKSWKWGSKGN